MKPKKYSESKIKTANKFLSKYELTFDSLDQNQKQSVTKYTSFRKCLFLFLVADFFFMTIFITKAYLCHTRAQTELDRIIESLSPEQITNAREFSSFFFEQGLLVGVLSFSALIMLIYIFLLLKGTRGRFQTINAFLPALKQSSDNEQVTSN